MNVQTHPPAAPSVPELVKSAVDAIGKHEPARDYVFDVDQHAMDLKPQAAGLRRILQTDPTVRNIQNEYRTCDEAAVNARGSFVFYNSLISVVIIGAIMLVLFLTAVPPGSEVAVRVGLAIAAGFAIATVLSNAQRAMSLRKALGRWYGVFWLAAGGVISAACFYAVVPFDFAPVITPILAAFYAVFLCGAVGADIVSGGITAKLLKWSGVYDGRGLHTRWYEARGAAEAKRRLLFMAVLNAELPHAEAEGLITPVPLLSQKLEYFRRYQVEVQQGYYADKSKENKSGAKRAEMARAVTYAFFFGLSLVVGCTLLARWAEQGTHVLPEAWTAAIVEFIRGGGDDLALLLALSALGAYIYLQLQSSMLREFVNHRRFGNILGQLRQATSPEPGKANLDNPSPLADARKAAAVGDRAGVEHFLRDVNRLLAAEVGDWSVMSSFVISTTGEPPKARLFTADKLTPKDFDQIVNDLHGYGGGVKRARKITFVAGRKAEKEEIVETRYNGLETTSTARPGDWIVTNMDINRQIIRDKEGHENTYVIQADRFGDLYSSDTGSSEFGDVFKAKGVVDAVEFPGGFDIVAPWGERQQAACGYLVRNGNDIYGIHADAYTTTYEVLP